jgi:hypothetical protein
MEITPEEIQKARRISRAIQEHLEQTRSNGLRSTDLYPMLVRKDLIEKDRHQGVHFRRFLIKLQNHGLLKLIPQCKPIPAIKNEFNEWYFYMVNHDKAELNDIKITDRISDTHNFPLNTEDETNEIINELRNSISLLPKTNRTFLPQEIETRAKYPRAYEIWTKAEIDILSQTFEKIKRIDKLAQLLERQPSAVEFRLKRLDLL